MGREQRRRQELGDLLAKICRVLLNRGCYQLGFRPFDTTKTKIENRGPWQSAALTRDTCVGPERRSAST